MTALGSIIGVRGIGIGLWWTDAVSGPLHLLHDLVDGVKNMR
jgi:hypothetical protein